jgi:hypothetical protein
VSDPADIAAEIMERAMSRAVVAAPVAPGTTGDCDDCGTASLRLVGGRCARCRDGRNG